MNQEEIEIIKQVQNGDNQAFEKLVRLHDRKVLQIAYGMLNNLQDAQDIYQEAFIRAYQKIGSFRFESEFSTWLGRIVINLSINRRKKRKAGKWFSFHKDDEENSAEMNRIPFEEANQENELLSREFQHYLSKAMDRLSEQQKATFTLKHMHGYKIKEIAVMLNCSEGTVKNHLFRAVAKLKGQLSPYYQKS